MTVALGAIVVILAAFVKGATGVGFPTFATPLLALFMDVKTVVVVLILPNILMDAIQLVRRGAPVEIMRRLATLLPCGAVGTVLGTALLARMPPRAAMLVLGTFVLSFVALNSTRLSPRVPRGWEPWMSPIVGLLAGVVGGVTNVPGTPLTIYFYALGMDKHEFVASLAVSFLLYKVVQLSAVAWYGLVTWPRLEISLALTGMALIGFWLGLRVQDRLDQRTFNRVVLAILFLLGAWIVARSLWWS